MQSGETCRLNPAHVPPTALDAQYGNFTAVMINQRGLDRGVAAAVQNQLGLGTEKTRGISTDRDIAVHACPFIHSDNPVEIRL